MARPFAVTHAKEMLATNKVHVNSTTRYTNTYNLNVSLHDAHKFLTLRCKPDPGFRSVKTLTVIMLGAGDS